MAIPQYKTEVRKKERNTQTRMPVLERLYSSEREAIHVISERRIEHARKEQTL